jgi:predicted DsbA family dithiol-disulfide isomerase
MQIDVWSDVVCPWCYLGEHRLARALAELSWGDEVQVRWRPYQLDPRAPLEPRDLRDALERKYGPGSFEAMTHRLTALGAAEGLEFHFDLAQRVNTFDAQRLLVWTGHHDPDRQLPLARRLFRSYFTEGSNVADRQVLLDAAYEVAIDTTAAASLLDGNDLTQELADEREVALERGITGVPAFIIAGRWHIPGAQEVETMVSVLERARRTLVP